MTDRPERVAVVGGGLAGSLLAIALARRGLEPFVIEKRPPYSAQSAEHGRSINLALAARGIAALERCEALAAVRPALLPMRGRMLHECDGSRRLAPYGQREHEVIYSVSRASLNQTLYELARDRHGIEYRFESVCELGDGLTPLVHGPQSSYALDDMPVFAADGAGSAIRRSLAQRGTIEAREDTLDHGYKELDIAPTPGGDFALEPDALHIWPRGDFMLIALPNTDRSFTATLFLPWRGTPSFESIGGGAVAEFFAREFADATGLIGSLDEQFSANPASLLGTVHCRPWSSAGRILLLGDAAHAIVPFHGQGMNAAFEDVLALDTLVARHGADWPRVFEIFESQRAPNTEAIAAMALENYREMRDTVRDPAFRLRSALAFELERRFPQFVPRYSMVMFHPEIAYTEAMERGRIEQRILERLTRGIDSLDAVDYALARSLIETELGAIKRRSAP